MPAPVNTGSTTVTISGPPSKGPAAVVPGPGTTGTVVTAPVPVGPPEAAPPAVTPGAGTGQSSQAAATPTPPVIELPVNPTGAGGGSTVVIGTVPNYIEVLADGSIIVQNATALNFTGTGVSITADGAVATMTIDSGGTLSKIVNGTSYANIPTANGNVTISSAGQIWNFNNNGSMTAPGAISATGNITGGNLTTAGTANVASLAVTGSVTVAGSVGVSSWITVSSYLSAAGNVLTGGVVSATGNVTGNFFIGNGSQLTGLAATYGNANVAANLAAFGSNPISTSGNITGGNVLGGANVNATTHTGTTVSVSANVTGGNVLTGGLISATGNVTGIRFFGDVGNVTYQQTTAYYVDPLRTANYTPTGTIIQPFANVTAAISAATSAGITDTNPAEIILLNNITENITLKPGIYLTSLGTGTHGSPTITGTVTVTSSSGTTVSNHYSISNLRIVAPTSGHCINFTGTFPQKLFMRDMWMDANGTGDCIYTDNTGTGSTVQFDVGHLTHSGTGDVYCINITKGNCYITDIETSGAVQVASVQTGAVLTIDGSELDATGDVVCETYGTGSLTITNSILTNTQAAGNGIKINSAGSTVTVGQCLFNIPAGAGSAIYYNPAATLYGSNFVYASVSFFPGTNSTIDARVLPVPLSVAVGTIINPAFTGNLTSATAGTWTLTDNSASSLSIDTTGKTGLLKFITTNSAEGVSMSGFASATGNVTGGNVLTGGLISATANITGGNVLTGGLISATGNITGGNVLGGANVNATTHTGTTVSVSANITGGNVLTAGILSATGNVTGNYFIGNGSQLTGITTSAGSSIVNGTSNVVVSASSNITANVTGNAIATFASTGQYVTGVISASGNITGGNVLGGANVNATTHTGTTVSVSANITGGNVLTGGLISATGNVNVGNLINAGLTSVTGNITGGNILTGGLISATANITGGNVLFGAGIVSGTGNITGGNVLGGANVNATTHTGTTVSVSANITGGNILFGAGIVSGTGNITGGNVLFGSGIVSGTGNITGGNLTIAGNTATITTANISIGYLNIPQISFTANATAALVDSGKHYYSTTSGNLALTIPTNATVAFPTGTALSLVVQASGNVLVNAAVGVTLYMGGNSTSGNRVVSAYGMATIMKVATDTWFINGTGVA